jgi:hypothetical protein
MAAPAAAAPQEQLLAADSVMSVVRLQVGAPEAVEGTVLAVDAGARLVVLGELAALRPRVRALTPLRAQSARAARARPWR